VTLDSTKRLGHITAKSWSQNCQTPVVYRIRISESNTAGYLHLDWIGYRFPFHPDPDYPNETKSGRANILGWNNSCMRANYDISKSYY